MKDRFQRLGSTMLGALCLLSTCGIAYSCSDDYNLDETKPSFLGGSIYDELKGRTDRTFKTTVRLVDDLGFADVLSKTGSLTLFVADDDAYARFFATTDWKDGNGNPVRSYEQLSTNQKRVLLNNAMLNNAYVMEMLPNMEGGRKYECLRQITNATATDSVPFWKWDQLPENLNTPLALSDGTFSADTRFWDVYRNEESPVYAGRDKKGIYMAVDATRPMMTHFLENHMKNKNLKHSDIAFVLNLPAGSWAEGGEGANGGSREYIYGRRVEEGDVTCLNGYYHVLDSVLVTPPNMAEVIRTNGQTNLFSQLLERFSAPFYNAELTQAYADLHPETFDLDNDTVYEKRYIAMNSKGNRQITLDPSGKSLGSFPYLAYDPAWNEYAISSTTVKENDMGAMFVPSDAAMEDYFLEGAGVTLMNRYAKLPNTAENLSYNLQQIPLDIIQALINNLMKDSFNESVPSKYLTIMNDAQDQMFPAKSYATEDEYKALFDRVILANNGVVYVMKKVISPADYAAVSAPVLYSENTQVFRTIIRADEDFVNGNSFNQAPLKQYISTYLKAMQSRFSLFVPTDEGLKKYGYVDPVSLATNIAANRRYWTFEYSTITAADNERRMSLKAVAYQYNPEERDRNSSVDEAVPQGYQSLANDVLDNTFLNNDFGATKRELAIEMVNQHIIVHDNADEEGVEADNQYYTSRLGAPIYVKKKGDRAQNGLGMQVEGGLQLDLNADETPVNDHVCTVVEGFNMTEQQNGYGNGMTYLLDRAMQPTMNSVYHVLQTRPEFSEFFRQCSYIVDTELLNVIGFFEGIGDKESDKINEANKYRLIAREDESGNHPTLGEALIRFFSNYRYTIYVPTDASMQAAYAKGLPSWQDIETFVEDNKDANGDITDDEVKAKARAMVVCLVNFLRYHFQDEVFYVDNITSQGSYQTSCIDNINNVYLTIGMQQTKDAIKVTDLNGETHNVIAPYNILARDMNFDKSPSSQAGTMRYVKVSSFAALHQIDGVMNFMPLTDGRYDSEWATATRAKRFVAKYKIRK